MKALLAAVTLMLGIAATAAAAELQGPIAALQPLLGTWEVDTAWKGGQRLKARAQYAPGIGGRTIEGRVLVKDGGAPPYQRYFTVYTWDEAGNAPVAHSFTSDGSHSATSVRFEDGVLITEWSEGDTRIRDRTALIDGRQMHWVVEVAGPGADFATIMDSTWQRVGGELALRPIDTNLFETGTSPRAFTARALIDAPVERVYAAWSDGATFRRTYAPESTALRANIELAIGGRFEWLWDGVTGSNDCQVLSFVPNRMLSFSWNAPPSQADSRAHRTWVVVEFESLEDGSTALELTHLGFGEGAGWDQTMAYFQKAWPHVLETFRVGLEGVAGAS